MFNLLYMAKSNGMRVNVKEPDQPKNFWTTQILIDSFLILIVLLIRVSKNTRVLILPKVKSTHVISPFPPMLLLSLL